MAYGLQIFNSNNDTVVDSEAKSSFQVSSVGTWANNGTLTNSDNEMIAINYSGGPQNSLISVSGSTWTNKSGVTLNYARVRETRHDADIPAASDYGLECYDANSNVTFRGSYIKGYLIEDFFAFGAATGGADSGAYIDSGTALHSGSNAGIYVAGPPPHLYYSPSIYGATALNGQYRWYGGTGVSLRYTAYIWVAYASSFTQLPNTAPIFVFKIRN